MDDYEEAKKVVNQVEQIVDLGEILIPVGEFIENNHRVEPSGWCTEWWQAIIESHNIENYDGNYDFESLSKYSKENNVPFFRRTDGPSI